jgi:signal transduction histidine kinase
MKPKTSRALYVLAATALVAVLGVLYMQTREIDFEANNEILSALRELKQIDAEWNVDVLRAKTGLANNYDKVASPLPLVESLKESLARKSVSVWRDRADSNARMTGLLENYTKLMDRKIDTIERFKSQNAILRNSSRFLPVATSDLVESTHISAIPAATQTKVEQVLDELLADTMIYLQTSDEALREGLGKGMQELEQLTQTLPPEVRERSDIMVAHVGTVVRQHQLGAQLLAELSALPTAKAIDDLSDAQAQEREKLLSSQQIYRQALVAYSVFLLLLLGFVGWRLFRNYGMLNKVNAALQKTNSELKESQVYLVQAEKMSALGQMVAGIAHEINTPLAYVKGTFSVLRDQLAPLEVLSQHSYDFTRQIRVPERDNALLNRQLRGIDASVKDVVESGVLHEMDSLLKDGLHGIEQISEIVLNLKNFSRLDRAKISDFSVNAGLDSTLLLANNLLKNKVEIRKDYGDVPNINGSPSQINQVFLNIITNAVHAMPERATANVITLRTAVEDADTVRVEIQDNGVGIPKDVLPKIFDPFFTTKPIGQGTGMGLSISYKIIQAHGGKLLVDTELEVGTVFTILLPIKAVQAKAESVIEDDLLFADSEFPEKQGELA